MDQKVENFYNKFYDLMRLKEPLILLGIGVLLAINESHALLKLPEKRIGGLAFGS